MLVCQTQVHVSSVYQMNARWLYRLMLLLTLYILVHAVVPAYSSTRTVPDTHQLGQYLPVRLPWHLRRPEPVKELLPPWQSGAARSCSCAQSGIQHQYCCSCSGVAAQEWGPNMHVTLVLLCTQQEAQCKRCERCGSQSTTGAWKVIYPLLDTVSFLHTMAGQHTHVPVHNK
jgi:hypothetical protein